MTDNSSTILVVDDTPTKRYILGSWLRRAGHEVVDATCGEEALRLVRTLSPDLVVLDVRLPDISGYEVCERIKADPVTTAIPVIQISAHAISVTDRTRGLDRGADAYMVEPIEPEEFIATVRAALRYYNARQRAERMAQRLRQLTEVTLEINSAITLDELLRVAVQGTATILGRRSGALAIGVDGRIRRYTVLVPGERATSLAAPQETLVKITSMVLGDAAGTAEFSLPLSSWLELLPDPRTRGESSGVVSRTKAGRPPVYLGVESTDPLDPDELDMLKQLGQALALAVDALRAYAEEHLIALTLQRSFLPSRIPVVPGLEVAVRYQPTVDNVEVGGDFYDAIPLGDRLLVAIGDVQGHSLYAATVMAELRHGLRALAVVGADLGRIMGRLNDMLRRDHPNMTATICLMLIDPVSGEVEMTNAGHIPPVIVSDGKARYLGWGNLLIGAASEIYRVDRFFLPERCAVLLFTDGLIEDRYIPLDRSMEVVRQMATAFDKDPEVFCDRLIDHFGAREDDVAVVALRRTR
ncbi:fused response regulator/phosphatase [Sphaerisporangium sp. TRM90804]|uniref:fused response regulator/phosphatase n=1 Tax=Sphaerisporangium sp. TRM90804 TaxID=3031113 RepID=UPI00244B4998|nr:fused response regulator/phosphatase [Sphaerisporangium sp. TRM90804]MDH2425123.1 fused response regulator/phosphatase [Sphaerisporangium sp. TRM90804]